MGFDKASIRVEGVALARRAGRLLSEVAVPAVEVGPGRSGLESVLEDPPGAGPLAAVGAGVRSLRAAGYDGGALVLACDLPMISRDALEALARWPGKGSVVPVVGGSPQLLCARWSAPDLDAVEGMLAAGERAMKALLARPGVTMAAQPDWPDKLDARALIDVDTPAELDRLGLRWETDRSPR
jgi:molybdopterin-guanine dinucleotide biosynthesis protein A